MCPEAGHLHLCYPLGPVPDSREGPPSDDQCRMSSHEHATVVPVLLVWDHDLADLNRGVGGEAGTHAGGEFREVTGMGRPHQERTLLVPVRVENKDGGGGRAVTKIHEVKDIVDVIVVRGHNPELASKPVRRSDCLRVHRGGRCTAVEPATRHDRHPSTGPTGAPGKFEESVDSRAEKPLARLE